MDGDSARVSDAPASELWRAATVGQLFPGLAHELGNHLLAIMATVELLIEDADPESELAARLRRVEASSLELRTLVRAVQDYAREPCRPGPARVSVEARSAVELLRVTRPRRDVRTEIDAESQLVDVASSRLQELLLALLLGADAASDDPVSIDLVVRAEQGQAAISVGGARLSELATEALDVLACAAGGSFVAGVLRLPLAAPETRAH